MVLFDCFTEFILAWYFSLFNFSNAWITNHFGNNRLVGFNYIGKSFKIKVTWLLLAHSLYIYYKLIHHLVKLSYSQDK